MIAVEKFTWLKQIIFSIFQTHMLNISFSYS